MTTTSGMPASTASMTAALVNAGGTKTTDTSAPVFSIASATVPKTGTVVPSKSTLSPALRGFTPPTMFVPEAIIRRVCFWPSEPVMPWTTTLLFSSRKIAMVTQSSLTGRELGGAVGRTVHRVDHRHQRVVRLVQDAAPLLDVVAVEAYDERLVRLVTEHLERVHDAVGHGVTRGDATEDVHEDALDLRVVQDDVQAVGHHLGRGATTDVEEVRGLHAGVLLTGVGDDVEGGHHEARAVADDADLAVELDVVEALLLGLGLEGVGRRLVLELRVVLVAEVGVLVEGHLAVERLEVAVAEADERVDLDERRVLLDEDVPQLLDHDLRLVGDLFGESGRGHDLGGLRVVDPGARVDRDLRDRVGVGAGDLLDLHATLDARDAEVVAVRAVGSLHADCRLAGCASGDYSVIP